MPRPVPWIAVVGPGEAAPEELALAEAVGAAVADAGALLVCGGLGGVMEAACRGARSRAGTTVGLLPGTDRTDANGWVTLAIPTGLGEARNVLIVRAADALIAVGGGWGTLSEIALARRTGRAVIGLQTWDLPDRGQGGGIVAAASAEEAVALALARVAGGTGARPVA